MGINCQGNLPENWGGGGGEGYMRWSSNTPSRFILRKLV